MFYLRMVMLVVGHYTMNGPSLSNKFYLKNRLYEYFFSIHIDMKPLETNNVSAKPKKNDTKA
jgi:hypothetical protein